MIWGSYDVVGILMLKLVGFFLSWPDEVAVGSKLDKSILSWTVEVFGKVGRLKFPGKIPL